MCLSLHCHRLASAARALQKWQRSGGGPRLEPRAAPAPAGLGSADDEDDSMMQSAEGERERD
eukprot:13371700-Alexandrium_andersonii.AAC.1